MTLRNGKAATVAGNFFLGEGKSRSGGIRVIDSDHTIVNNYIADVDDRADGAISLAAGIDSGIDSLYKPVTNVDIHNNTIVDVGGAAVIFDWGFGDTDDGGIQDQLPENISLINNLIRSKSTPLFLGHEGTNYVWVDNIAFGAGLGIAARAGLQAIAPQIAIDSNGLWRPISSSPAINAGTAITTITDDIDGQPRVGAFDIGADKASAAAVTRIPLSADDVGPSWESTVEPPVDPPVGNFFALQAEDFAALTDPDGDGVNWSIVNDSSAHGGQAIVSPPGPRTDLPSQETIALYNVSSSVGVTQQLRIGRRESGNRIDVIVIHPSPNLGDEALDGMFADAAFLLGDINQDGTIGFLDINPFITILSSGEFQAEADCNQDGVVNFLDIAPWIDILTAQ